MKKKDKVVRYNVDTDLVSTNIDNFLSMIHKAPRVFRKHAYVVLEHSDYLLDHDRKKFVASDERIHGVYTTRQAAEQKRERLYKMQIGGGYGNISILQFKIKG